MPALIFGADQEELRLAFDDLEWAPLTSLFSVDLPLTLDLKPEALRSKTSKTFFQLEKKRHHHISSHIP